MQMKRFQFLMLAAVVSIISLCGSDFALAKEDQKYAFSMPINAAKSKGNRVHLNVSIPENFRTDESSDYIVTPNKPHEFYPKKDGSLSKWSELIIVQVILGIRVDSEELAKAVKDQYMSGTKNAKLLDFNTVTNADYNVSKFAIHYTNPYANRQEVMKAIYYCGPYDCANYQYTVALNKNIDVNKALEIIKDFTSNPKNISISKF